MAPVLGDPVTVRIDPVTLAALQDTGWYAVDLSRAQSLVWGGGKTADIKLNKHTINTNKCPLLGEGNLFGSLSTCRGNSSFFCSGR